MKTGLCLTLLGVVAILIGLWSLSPAASVIAAGAMLIPLGAVVSCSSLFYIKTKKAFNDIIEKAIQEAAREEWGKDIEAEVKEKFNK